MDGTGCSFFIAYESADEETAEKRFTGKNMCRLQPAVYMAEKMGTGLGGGEVLQRQVQIREAKIKIRKIR